MIAYLLAGVLIVISSAEGTTLDREKRSVDFITGKCDASQTQIYTRTIKTAEFTKCPISTLISRYYEPFLDECEHWMGSRPDHIASSYVYYCLEDPQTGGVIIKATICCKGTLPANRCVTCTSTDPEQCDYENNAVVTCAADEVCQTRLTCSNNALQATIHKSCVKKPCSQANSCAAKTYLEYGQECSDCCESAVCNKGGHSLTCYASCRCDNMVSGHYHCDASGRCICNEGCTGSRCETCTATCNPNPCKNGGRCEKVGSSVNCCCKPGYGGQYCQNKLPSCDRSACSYHGECVDEGSKKLCICDPGYYGETCQKIPDVFNCPSSKNIYFSNPSPFKANCASVVSTTLSRTSELGACRYYMRSQYGKSDLFEEGKNGHVDELTDVGYNTCYEGDCGYAYYQTKTCCPSCFSNPCQNGGYCLQTEQNGIEEDYVCRCKFGFTGKYCEKRVQTCFAFGEPHFITFDGQFITHQGVCRYILTAYTKENSGLTPFIVYVKNEYRTGDHSVSYPSYIETDVFGYRIRLGRNNVVQVKAANEDFKIVSLNAIYSDFSIKTVSRFVRLETNFGLVVQFDGYNMMFVQIPDTYAGKLSGICNNMDGDVSNDLRDCTGIQRTDDAEGHTKYGDSCLDPQFSSDSGSCETKVPSDCDSSKYEGNEWCGQIINKNGPFASCINSDSRYDFIACTYDVCHDQSAKCQALESFVEKCYKKGGSPSANWRNVTGCPMNCPAHAHYEFSGSACHPTCENPRAQLACEFDDTEVCQCDNNMLLRDGQCVPKDQCGCRDSENVRHMVNDVWNVDLEKCEQQKCVLCSGPNCTTPGKIIKEQTTAVNGNWGEWSEWSACGSGSNRQTRTRQCNNPKPTCGGATCVGSMQEGKDCPTTLAPPTTTTPTTTTTTPPTAPPTPACVDDFDFARACGECDRTRNPNMYIANPCGCESFYQCIPDQFGGYQVIEMPCSYCTCWNQTILTCDHDVMKRNKNHDKCQEKVLQEIVSQTSDGCMVRGSNGAYSRRFRAVAGDNTYYIDVEAGDIKMPCAPGTVFDVNVCGCVHGTNNRRIKEFMCLTFNDKNNPYKTTTGLWVSPSASGLQPGESGVYGYGLRFDGGNLEVPAFNNKEINRITISLWYKRDRVTYSGVQALISNDDCTQKNQASIQILSRSLTSVGGGIRTQISDILSDLITRVANDRKWHHVAMTYDKDTKMAAFYLDGILRKKTNAEGSIPGAHCPLLIGSTYAGNYFHGVMDQICFYDKAFSASEVRSLYDEYSP